MAGPSSVLVLVAALLAWTFLTPDDDADEPYVAQVPSATSSALDAGGAAQALQGLVTALNDGDRAAAAALAAPDDSATSTRLAELADTAAAARIGDLSMRYITEAGGRAADGTWAAEVDVAWAYEGFDDEPTATGVQVRFRDDGDGVRVAGIGGGSLRTPVWMSGPMQVRRTDDLLVVAAAGLDLDSYVQTARRALPVVERVLTAWTPRLVVEVPADRAALESALGSESGYYAQIAAVTGSGGLVGPDAPNHVFVNPEVFDGLGRAGQDVVLAHESTHVATDAPASQAPTWLVEGFADYVALRDTRLPLTRTAKQVAQQVRTDGVPDALPTPAEFDTRGPHLGAVYESAWLICETLAAAADDAVLVAFYDAVSAGADVAAELRAGLGWTEADLVRAWQDRLRDLPGAA
ncbi:hypothetical protein ABFT23_14670 [Nocardioides sp. C4-1]|uniref:hypothetical protein n=1 Tax=Nocardioides sp. C4-1 TaxID=3151851 RepID=UPI0032667F13